MRLFESTWTMWASSSTAAIRGLGRRAGGCFRGLPRESAEVVRARIAFLAPAVALAAAGCESRPTPAVPVIVVDSTDVRIATSDPFGSGATCPVGEDPFLVLGDREDDPAHLFGRVDGVARLSDGSVAVADNTVAEVRIFDETGEHVRSLGGRGDGPGEFKNASSVWARPGDTLWVGDYRPWRYNVFAADGHWSRAVELDPIYLNPPRNGGGVLANGTLVATKLLRVDDRNFRTPDTTSVEVHDADGKRVGVLARIPNLRWGTVPEDDDFYIFPVFASAAYVSARGDRIALGTSRDPEIRVFDSEYKLVVVVRWNAGDRSVRRSDVDAFREAYRETRAWAGEPNTFDAARMSSKRPVADMFPAFRAILMGNDGHLLVFPYDRPRQDRKGAMVFAPTGEFLCHVEQKPGFSVWEAGPGYLLGVHEDEMENETVMLYSFGPLGQP